MQNMTPTLQLIQEYLVKVHNFDEGEFWTEKFSNRTLLNYQDVAITGYVDENYLSFQFQDTYPTVTDCIPKYQKPSNDREWFFDLYKLEESLSNASRGRI